MGVGIELGTLIKIMTKILYNPTTSDITVTIKGVDYTINALGKLTVPKDVAMYWVNSLHNFLNVLDDEVDKATDKVEEIVKEVLNVETIEISNEPVKKALSKTVKKLKK